MAHIFHGTGPVLLHGSGSPLLAFMLILNHNATFYLIQLSSLALIVYFILWLLQQQASGSRRAFISINVYYLAVMIILITDILISRS